MMYNISIVWFNLTLHVVLRIFYRLDDQIDGVMAMKDSVTDMCLLIWRRHHLEYWLTPHCGSQLAKHVTGVTPMPDGRFVWLVRRMVQGMRTCLTCGLLVYSY